MSRIREIIYYFNVYKKYMGNRLYLVFILNLLAVVTESFGIALLLPLIKLVESDGNTEPESAVGEFISKLLEFFGIEGSLSGILIFISAVFILKGIIKFVEGAYNSFLESELMREIKLLMFNAYENMDYKYYCKNNTGHFINMIAGQTSALVKSFASFKSFITTLITVCTYFAFSFLISWQFTTAAFIFGFIILLLFKGLNNYVRDLSRKSVIEHSYLNKFLVQTMQAYKYLSATAEIGPLKKAVMNSVNKLSALLRKQGVATAFTAAIREPLSIFVLVVIIIIQINIFNQNIAPIFVSLLLIYRAMSQVMGLQSSWQKLMGSIGSLEVVEEEFEVVRQNQQRTGNVEVKGLQREVELQDVSFFYENSHEIALKNINLKIHANTTTAIVGESGAGKSTLVDILTLMLRPTGGNMLVDGVSIDDINVNQWRSCIGFVSQDTVIFDDTVANNICLWRGEYNKDESVKNDIENAAERAYAKSFIDSLPEGFNTIVGERGIRLSGGQKQRLFIARELYKKPKLLILDEATSALDSESELYIKQSIDDLKGAATIVLIAHRLSTIKQADNIIVINNGEIIESGDYEKLVSQTEGYFHKMVGLQTLQLS